MAFLGVTLFGENVNCLLTFGLSKPLAEFVVVPSTPLLFTDEGVEKLDFGFNTEFDGVKKRLWTVPGVL